ncbi:hypothetical protein MANES_06G052300v8 [Manihot esculenta]|uniref:FAD-binding PCMH-type domain-containing protein n=1 Tax=Manihot esculenta TaxID=3983 RepID=A0A2C9VN58_MANES|nr:hypothetical protein MANES_06G052300v8 [Manihot esculenta]
MKLSVFFILFITLVCLAASDDSTLESFLHCLPSHVNSSNPISKAIIKPSDPSFQSALEARVKNLRFLTPATPKPLAIIAATDESHVQATVVCAKSSGLQIRVRSGGHDYEGLSYRSEVPFIILDMFNFNKILIQLSNETAWVEAGATLGELYYQIANQSRIHAFPGGVCPTVATGGHFSGGGYGNLMRKFGLSVDNIIDARIVDANGTILDRQSMGEDLFWAIRGGGGASFGVILSWRINLVRVPEIVTIFQIGRTIEQGAADILHRWQEVAPYLDKDLFIRATSTIVNSTIKGEKMIEVSFIGLFLGQIDRLLPLINESFPELGLQKIDCEELSWIESTLFFADFPKGTPIDVLLQKPSKPEFYSKGKSDYVKVVIPKSGLETLWKMMLEVGLMFAQFNPYGGRMGEVSETSTPFPHRAGYRFLIQYSTNWQENDGIDTEKQINLLRELYDAMAPYVSKKPREAFLNYRDDDIGSNPSNFTNFNESKVYGHKYFKNNFIKLTKVKARVDPDNFFKHQQSIPPGFV